MKKRPNTTCAVLFSKLTLSLGYIFFFLFDHRRSYIKSKIVKMRFSIYFKCSFYSRLYSHYASKYPIDLRLYILFF